MSERYDEEQSKGVCDEGDILHVEADSEMENGMQIPVEHRMQKVQGSTMLVHSWTTWGRVRNQTTR